MYVDDIKLAGKKPNIYPMWKLLSKEVDLGEPTSFLDHVYLGCTQRQCQISKDIVDNYRTMFESRISEEGVEKLPFLKIFVFLHGLMIWRVTQRNVWSALIHNLQKDEVEVCRQETPEAEASKSFLKGTCTESLCEYWHPPECQFCKTKSGCKFGAQCSFPHWRFEEQPNRCRKRAMTKVH